MPYFVTFLEGLVTFLSPCLLPMLPIYLSYFAGGSPEQSPRRVLKNALAFVLGFTVLFVLMGGFAGTIGALFSRYQTAVNVVCGLVVICFGLHFLGLFDLPFFRGSRGFHRTQDMGFFSTLLFGCVFAVGWTPCIGAFLGSALMLASQQGSALEGILLLLCYSIGLGVPFLLSALLLQSLRDAFQWIKAHYGLINRACGVLLILIGLLMATGMMNRLLIFLS